MPLVRLVTVYVVVVAPLPGMSVQPGFQFVPPSALTRYWYLVMALSLGLSQFRMT